jgi:hypothetical protein
MAIYALIGILPLLAYCVVQTVRDYRSKSVLMCVWGIVMVALLAWLAIQTGRVPSY